MDATSPPIWSDVPLALYFWNSCRHRRRRDAAQRRSPASRPATRWRASAFPGRQIFLIFIVGTQMFSPVVLLLALFLMLNVMGLLNTHLALIFINAAVALPFTVWMMTAYFSSIPVRDRGGRRARWRGQAAHPPRPFPADGCTRHRHRLDLLVCHGLERVPASADLPQRRKAAAAYRPASTPSSAATRSSGTC